MGMQVMPSDQGHLAPLICRMANRYSSIEVYVSNSSCSQGLLSSLGSIFDWAQWESALFFRGLLGVLDTLHDLFCSLLLMVWPRCSWNLPSPRAFLPSYKKKFNWKLRQS